MDGQSIIDRASIPPLIHNNATFVSNLNKANILGQSFQQVSSSDNFTDELTFNNPYLKLIRLVHLIHTLLRLILRYQ